MTMITEAKEGNALFWLLTLDRRTGQCWTHGPYTKDEAWRYARIRRDGRFYAAVVNKRP